MCLRYERVRKTKRGRTKLGKQTQKTNLEIPAGKTANRKANAAEPSTDKSTRSPESEQTQTRKNNSERILRKKTKHQLGNQTWKSQTQKTKAETNLEIPAEETNLESKHGNKPSKIAIPEIKCRKRKAGRQRETRETSSE